MFVRFRIWENLVLRIKSVNSHLTITISHYYYYYYYYYYCHHHHHHCISG